MLKVPKGGLWKPKESMLLDQRIRDSAKWATWALQWVAFIQHSMHEWQKGLDHVVRADSERQVRLQQLMLAEGAGIELWKGFCTRALKGPEAERFRQHCLAGHRPWRSDCKACLDAMSYSRPHRRMQKSRACALSIDVSGPFKVDNAEDYEVKKPKYMLVGAYTFPVFSKPVEQPEATIPDEDEAERLQRGEEVEARPMPSEGEGSHEPHFLQGRLRKGGVMNPTFLSPTRKHMPSMRNHP